ncbi:hypothetical protein [Actinomycetospora sp. CA-084318]|uniref:hypothetical protein n=1 Tax=Actinomycetospora sp. CA-084318 TaxID=3239892 RepID=UPI003D97C342
MSTQAPDENPLRTSIDTARPDVPGPRWPTENLGRDGVDHQPSWAPGSAPAAPASHHPRRGVAAWTWIGIGVVTAVVLIAATAAITVAVTSKPESAASRPSSTSTTPLPYGSMYMPDFRGQTAQTAADILRGQLGGSTSVSAPGGAAAANEIVTSSVPAPGTVINGATSFLLYTAGSSTNGAAESGAQAGTTTSGGTLTAGTYEVGSEVQPGTYKTVSSGRCYYERLRNLDGGIGSIIDNENVEGQGILEIKSSDKYVKISGSCVWTKQ